jgi:MinD-like ATPase involved in chromosome partitioning or flagellar assembly
VITVFSAKGGCGKTTLATNLASRSPSRGRGKVASSTSTSPSATSRSRCSCSPPHDRRRRALGAELDGPSLRRLCSPALLRPPGARRPGGAECGRHVDADLVARILELLREEFDYVVVDTPPAFDDHVLAAFDRSDVVALMATLDIPALKNLKLTLETLDLINYPRDKLAVVLNRADSKVGLSICPRSRRRSRPRSWRRSRRPRRPASINRGVAIVSDDPKHPVSLAIQAFIDDQIAGQPSDARRSPRRCGATGALHGCGGGAHEPLGPSRPGTTPPRPARLRSPSLLGHVGAIASPPAPQIRSPSSSASVHASLLESLGPQLYDSRLTEEELAGRRSGPPSRRCCPTRRPPSRSPTGRGWPRRSPTTSSATARSSPSCATPRSPRSWSTGPRRSTSSARAG